MNCLGRCSVTYTVPLPSFLRVSLNVLRRFKLLKIWALSMALDSFTIIGLVTLAPCRITSFCGRRCMSAISTLSGSISSAFVRKFSISAGFLHGFSTHFFHFLQRRELECSTSCCSCLALRLLFPRQFETFRVFLIFPNSS